MSGTRVSYHDEQRPLEGYLAAHASGRNLPGAASGTRTRHVLGKAGASFQRASQTSDVGSMPCSLTHRDSCPPSRPSAVFSRRSSHSGPFWTPSSIYPPVNQQLSEL